MGLSYNIIITLFFLNNLKEIILSGINAAPNESVLKGEITKIEWSGSTDDKVTIIIKVAEYHSIFGPVFLEKGQIISVFFYTNSLDLQLGDHISAHVEYLGSPSKGVFQLLKYKTLNN